MPRLVQLDVYALLQLGGGSDLPRAAAQTPTGFLGADCLALIPARTNVQLVRVDGRHDLTVLVWERGAGETSASGSSSVAAAAVAVARGWCDSPVAVHLPGGDLHVRIADGRASLTGPAEQVAWGSTTL